MPFKVTMTVPFGTLYRLMYQSPPPPESVFDLRYFDEWDIRDDVEVTLVGIIPRSMESTLISFLERNKVTTFEVSDNWSNKEIETPELHALSRLEIVLSR
jgi:hypothetical protein